MCIIVAKQKGVGLPTKKTLQNCYNYNNDGAGIMYVKDNKVIIEKGFMTFSDFWHKIKELKKEFNSDLTDKALVMHFRIGTHGENDKETTHPFPISGNDSDLRATYFETDIAMAHNGIISAYNYDKVLSDTQSFIKDFVSVFKELNKNFYKNENAMKIIAAKANIATNKLCFLDKNENIYYYGNKVLEDGVIYSNDTFKESKKTYSYSSYHWNYDNYYYNNYGYGNHYSNTYANNKIKSDIKKETIKYYTLQPGEVWETIDTADVVDKNEIIKIDNRGNLYQKVDGVLSLIGTNAVVYDQYWKEKEINFS